MLIFYIFSSSWDISSNVAENVILRGLNKTLNKRWSGPKRGLLLCHILANISGTRWDTETFYLPNERSCFQFSNGGLKFSVALVGLKIYPLKRFRIFGEHRNNFLRCYIFKTISATEKISTSFKSCKQDLSFGGCNFSVSYLVPEILALTRPKSDSHLGLTPPFRPSFLSHSDHVWPDISGTS